jgi:hypothetical protein
MTDHPIDTGAPRDVAVSPRPPTDMDKLTTIVLVISALCHIRVLTTQEAYIALWHISALLQKRSS